MKRKQIGSSLILIAVLLQAFLLGTSLAQTAVSTQYIMGGVYPGAPSYTVWKEGSTYYAKDAFGQLDFSSTNATYIVQSAQGLGHVIQFINGEYVFSVGIKILFSGQHFIGDSRESSSGTVFKVADGADITLISGDVTTWEFYMSDIFLNGNKANNAVGNGIDYTSLNTAWFMRVYPYQFSGSGFYSEGGGAYFTQCNSAENDGHGWYIKNNWGGKWDKCYTRANVGHGYYITSNGTGCGDLDFIGCETDGGSVENDGFHIIGENTKRIKITNANNLNMMGSGLYVGDHASNVVYQASTSYACAAYGIELNHVTLCEVNAIVGMNHKHGIYFHNETTFSQAYGCLVDSNSQDGVGTYDGIVIDDSSSCTIESCMVRGYDEIHDYSIHVENGTPSRNLIISCHASDAKADKNIVITGTGTYVVHSYNDTTYIATYP